MQLQPLDDGYDRQFRNCMFRRMLEPERSTVLRLASAQGVESIYELCEEHIVHGSVEWDNEPIARRAVIEITGLRAKHEDDEDASNLREGVWLELMYPEVMGRRCTDCREWWYDHSTGRIARKGGALLRRVGPVMCETSAGCIKGHYSSPRGLSKRNRKAYDHYKDCRAICSFPDDPTVKRNARIIRDTIEAFNGRRTAGRNQGIPHNFAH